MFVIIIKIIQIHKKTQNFSTLLGFYLSLKDFESSSWKCFFWPMDTLVFSTLFDSTLFTAIPQPSTSHQTKDKWPTDAVWNRNMQYTLLRNCCSTKYLSLDVGVKSCFVTVPKHFWICWASFSDFLSNSVNWSEIKTYESGYALIYLSTIKVTN